MDLFFAWNTTAGPCEAFEALVTFGVVDGLRDGLYDGLFEGAIVGDTVGFCVGSLVGDLVGLLHPWDHLPFIKGAVVKHIWLEGQWPVAPSLHLKPFVDRPPLSRFDLQGVKQLHVIGFLQPF